MQLGFVTDDIVEGIGVVVLELVIEVVDPGIGVEPVIDAVEAGRVQLGLDLRGDGDSPIRVEGGMRSGDGRLEFQGEIDARSAGGPGIDLQINQGEKVALVAKNGSGKTTLARRISEDLNAKLILERFADNPFLPKFYEDQARYAFPLELSFLADRYQQFIEDTRQLDLFRNFVVSDYDIYKSLIFAKITLGEEEFRLYRKFFSFMYKEVRKPGLYVYLYQRTERLLEHISRRGRDYEKGIPKEYLEEIQKGYFEFMKNTQELNSVIIDVGELDFVAREGDYFRVLDQMVAHVLSPFA